MVPSPSIRTRRSSRSLLLLVTALPVLIIGQSGCRTTPVEPTRSTNGDGAPPAVVPERDTPSEVVSLPGGIVCDRTRRQVRVPGVMAIDSGFLEQVACTRGTREHEALVVVTCRPSDVHAALLLLGLESGRPGHWAYSEESVDRIPPSGAPVRVHVRFVDETGAIQEHPIGAWMVGQPGERPFPEQPWIFGGSVFDEATAHYRADSSGSVIGLVTFGDEVLGLGSVIADSIEVDAAEWEVRTYLVPPPGTPVELVLSPWIEDA